MNQEQLLAQLREIDHRLGAPKFAALRERVEGPKSMARLTHANLLAFKSQVDRLGDSALGNRLMADPFGRPHQVFIEKLQHLAANYFLSAVPLLEHLNLHVETHYPDQEDITRVQFHRGRSRTVLSFDGHAVVIQLRHMVAHRQLPTVALTQDPTGRRVVRATIDRTELLADQRCGKTVRSQLEELPTDDISLSDLIQCDGEAVLAFADWFFHMQSIHHKDELTPLWKLWERRKRLVESLARNSEAPSRD